MTKIFSVLMVTILLVLLIAGCASVSTITVTASPTTITVYPTPTVIVQTTTVTKTVINQVIVPAVTSTPQPQSTTQTTSTNTTTLGPATTTTTIQTPTTTTTTIPTTATTAAFSAPQLTESDITYDFNPKLLVTSTGPQTINFTLSFLKDFDYGQITSVTFYLVDTVNNVSRTPTYMLFMNDKSQNQNISESMTTLFDQPETYVLNKILIVYKNNQTTTITLTHNVLQMIINSH